MTLIYRNGKVARPVADDVLAEPASCGTFALTGGTKWTLYLGIVDASKSGNWARLVQKISSQPYVTHVFLDAFGFTPSGMTAEAYREAMRYLPSDFASQYLNFHIGNTGAPCEKDLYHFEERSPYFLHNSNAENHDASLKFAARETAHVWIEFAYGIEPWEAHTFNKRVRRVCPAVKWEIITPKADRIRDYGYLKLVGKHFDRVRIVGRSTLSQQVRGELLGLPH
ncbi:hypothetical protein UA08_03093 [Talaromyces atroroseus]|uniref:Uncharacterized protein n=1 Tax=Talaromyces atroroseus TaxID=1441469 RepID=A0A225ANS4_TALAT|nr:hypothetical protein UA08_03093 [Talaromyces atroroseus]OKL61123.1 hypothetical protein UA08_03093 [Talaromyces atroroseus]